MDQHLEKIDVPQNYCRTDLIFNKIDNILFEFEDYSFSVNGNKVRNINITPNGNIVLQLAFLDINLYNSYVCEDKIISITEIGTAFSPVDKNEEIKYKTSYKNYRFKTMSGEKPEFSDWIFVLEKADV